MEIVRIVSRDELSGRMEGAADSESVFLVFSPQFLKNPVCTERGGFPVGYFFQIFYTITTDRNHHSRPP